MTSKLPIADLIDALKNYATLLGTSDAAMILQAAEELERRSSENV